MSKKTLIKETFLFWKSNNPVRYKFCLKTGVWEASAKTFVLLLISMLEWNIFACVFKKYKSNICVTTKDLYQLLSIHAQFLQVSVLQQH
jgi:hypothetical protein